MGAGVAESTVATAAALPTAPAAQRLWITIALVLATTMQTLDSTIANVALPHMQGAMSATQDQIAWVLTSYIVATAIFIPLTGYVAARFGRRHVMLVAVFLFTASSMACGAAQTLEQLVAFRFVQGASGACLVPLSQAMLLDVYPRELHGRAMSLWGVGVMVGPILGPTLGGWLTETQSWRWVFYINLPIGLLALVGIGAFVRDGPLLQRPRFDATGFALLGLGIACVQLMLDRGELLGWFDSPEIVAEAVIGSTLLAMFLWHLAVSPAPFLEPRLFADRNFAVGMVMIFLVGMILLTTMALLPTMLQTLYGYPVIDVGVLLASRGVGTMATMLLAGRLPADHDPRPVLLSGLAMSAVATGSISTFGPDTGAAAFVLTGLLQGVGLGLIFPPLSAMTFATLAPAYRNEGASLFQLLRNLGSSVAIAVAFMLLAQNRQANQAVLVEQVTPFNLGLRALAPGAPWRLDTQSGLAVIEAEVHRQAALLAYLQDFQVLTLATVAAIPLLLLFRRPAPMRPRADRG